MYDFLETIKQQVCCGIDPQRAVRNAIAELSNQLDYRVRGGIPIEAALSGIAIHPRLASLIAREIVTYGRTVSEAMTVIFTGGPIEGIPTAECLARHLPPDREPTQEEYDEAYAACSKIQIQK